MLTLLWAARHRFGGSSLLQLRLAAWMRNGRVLLEERLRDATTFSGAGREEGREGAPSGRAHDDRHRGLAGRHFADWGAASRFLTDGGGGKKIGPLHFDEDIKALFRGRDRESMRFAFDLWSLDEVSTHAHAILERLEAGTMPCDGASPAERVAVFRGWIDAGKPA